MAEISKITLPSGTTYDIKDATARAAIVGGTSFLGVTTTELTDGSTATTIVIGGESVSAINGGIAVYGNKEFIYADADLKWHEFGDASNLGDLAYKDDASGTITPAGTVSAPTISVSSAGSTASVTPIDSVGTLPSLTMTVSSETLSIAFSQGTLPTAGTAVTVKTGDASYEATAPTFSGTQQTVTVS